ncbi:hypothetical protein AB0D29_24875 [Streptomyces sp. NPDC048424]|uniref:hypothetical protein n=1 Tax=Streptomyces sp. NPDC048424 TaxID=3155265 RepID=UPI00343E5489
MARAARRLGVARQGVQRVANDLAIHQALTADIATPDIAVARSLLHRLIDEVRRHEDGD